MIEVRENDLTALIGGQFLETPNGIIDERMGDLRHATAWDFAFSVKRAVEQGHVD